MMTDKELMQWALTLSPEMRARVERLANGDLSVAPDPIGDARTCTQAEAARLLGVSRTTVVNMIKDGRLATVMIGGGGKRVLMRSIGEIAQGKDVEMPDDMVEEMRQRKRRRAESGRKGAVARMRTLAGRGAGAAGVGA